MGAILSRLRAVLWRHRVLVLALAASLALHAAVLRGVPVPAEEGDEGPFARYTATLVPQATLVEPAPRAAPAKAPRKPPRPRPRPAPPPPEVIAAAAAPAAEAIEPAPASEPVPPPPESAPEPPPPEPEPDRIALAQPAVPLPPPKAEPFPTQALPESLTIDYQLTSPFADGRASYRWSRDGDRYTITGEAEATGFFTLFLEGRILQESQGSVTAEGLRPERFRERKPNAAEEGLDFDWAGRTVTFEKGDEKKTAVLADNTVDWLSMIFQLAHRPPGDSAFDIQVFTQRRMYRFNLKVLGVEEVDIPMGRVRALHLRHEPPEANQAVDVWLGLDQHYLPVKMRYPVARNRFMVDQVATRVSGP